MALRCFQNLLGLMASLLLTQGAFAWNSQVQFFGDLYLPRHIVRNDLQQDPSRSFSKVETLLQSSEKNVVNLEGALTNSQLARDVTKTHLLRMNPNIANIFKKVGIDAVSLANNHTIDFGAAGLFDTLASLSRAGIGGFGAGMNQSEAERPLIISTSAGPACLVAYSLTLPENHWAVGELPGTAHGSFSHIKKQISTCAKAYPFTFAVFHWGAENRKTPKDYQVLLAHKAIDAGATAVIGHHPHVLQPVEIYKGRPIAYSLGNFAFGTRPHHSIPEGAAIRFQLSKTETTFELIPLAVNNREVVFQPHPISDWKKLPEAVKSMPDSCKKLVKPIRWNCRFQL